MRTPGSWKNTVDSGLPSDSINARSMKFSAPAHCLTACNRELLFAIRIQFSGGYVTVKPRGGKTGLLEIDPPFFLTIS